MPKLRLTLAALLSAILTACAPPPVYNAYNFDRNIVSFPEIERTHAASALDLIRKTRPNFLASRGATTFIGTSWDMPTVYVDGMRYGSMATLKDIPASSIAEIRMYRAGEGVQFGPGNMGGVLSILTRRN